MLKFISLKLSIPISFNFNKLSFLISSLSFLICLLFEERILNFILSIFIGYYVVWSVTPSLHTPLMSVTNAISSVIIVGAIIASLAGNSENIFDTANLFGFLAIILAAINIFGGFLVTQRMLQMYKKKKDKK